MKEEQVAADDLSPANLPPVAWTSDSSPREPRQETDDKDKKVRKFPATDGQPKPPSADVEFEKVEHELDSIA